MKLTDSPSIRNSQTFCIHIIYRHSKQKSTANVLKNQKIMYKMPKQFFFDNNRDIKCSHKLPSFYVLCLHYQCPSRTVYSCSLRFLVCASINFSLGMHFSQWGWIVYAVLYFGVYKSAPKSTKCFQPRLYFLIFLTHPQN